MNESPSYERTPSHGTANLKAAKAGDSDALNALLKEVQPRIFQYGMRMCRHQQDAEDILQETMLAMANNLEDFRGDASLTTWAYSIARNFCIKRRKKTGREQPQGQPEEVARRQPLPSNDDASGAIRKESWDAISAALAELPTEYREMIILRDIQGMSANEAGEITGSSVAAVKSRLHRARNALRQVLGVEPARPGCPDVVDAFSKNLEGELSSENCAELQAHLDTCPRCRGVCSALKKDLQLCQLAPQGEIPKELSLRIQERVKYALRDGEAL